MGAGSKMSRCPVKALVVALAIASLQCGGKTTVYLGTSPGEPTASAGTNVDGAAQNDSGGLGLGGSLGPSDVCPPGTSTTVSGIVYDPAGKVPLYNVLAYIPGVEEVVPPQDGLSCGKCSTQISAASAALSDGTGHFLLNDAPPGEQLLVIQIGKWFREARISVTACKDNPLTVEQTSLPRSGKGLPRIAVTTGHSDMLECLLRKIGIADTEFTTDQDPNNQGHVHMFVGCPNPDAGDHVGASAFMPPLNGGAKFPQATTLWADRTKLSKYDMVVMSCEGTQCTDIKDATMKGNIKDYADNGGRLFLSHDQFVWLRSGPAPWPQTADYVGADRNPLPSPFISQVDDTFFKGKAFSSWLQNVGASTTPGAIEIKNARFSVRATKPPTQRWIYTTENPEDSSGMAVEYFTLNTPVEKAIADPDNPCGRVVFTDLHLLASEPGKTADVAPFPSACDLSQTLSPQELALEFMIFDLSSCLLPENKEPLPPAVLK